jgi:hypothetical protein
MNTDQAFPLSLDFEGQHYRGKITPSEEKGGNGVPVYFRVEIGGSFYAYLCCSDNGWKDKDGDDKPKGLVNAIGKYIWNFYE